MNPNLSKLHPYPFEKLRILKQGFTPPSSLSPILMSIGEPKHPTPEIIKQGILDNLPGLAQYPLTRGSDELRSAIANWLNKRFKLCSMPINADSQILPVNGTREALFAITQCLVDPSENTNPLVCVPNPFYQIYEGAALLSGAQAYYLNTTADNGFIPDYNLEPKVWQQCQILFTCSPGNPSGAVMNLHHYKHLIDLSHKYNFVLIGDECYSEIYRDEQNPPLGLLEACEKLGNHDYKNCLVFHSLSKRSNAPGLRSGFVAGDSRLINHFQLFRTYHGCAMSPPVQNASKLAWSDENHVIENRKLYREKFDLMSSILIQSINCEIPQGSFYLWLETPISDTQFCEQLYAKQNITALPGSYLSREVNGINPGQNRIRLALVSANSEIEQAARRLKTFIDTEQFML